jgi:hypothetical protein
MEALMSENAVFYALGGAFMSLVISAYAHVWWVMRKLYSQKALKRIPPLRGKPITKAVSPVERVGNPKFFKWYMWFCVILSLVVVAISCQAQISGPDGMARFTKSMRSAWSERRPEVIGFCIFIVFWVWVSARVLRNMFRPQAPPPMIERDEGPFVATVTEVTKTKLLWDYLFFGHWHRRIRLMRDDGIEELFDIVRPTHSLRPRRNEAKQMIADHIFAILAAAISGGLGWGDMPDPPPQLFELKPGNRVRKRPGEWWPELAHEGQP